MFSRKKCRSQESHCGIIDFATLPKDRNPGVRPIFGKIGGSTLSGIDQVCSQGLQSGPARFSMDRSRRPSVWAESQQWVSSNNEFRLPTPDKPVKFA